MGICSVGAQLQVLKPPLPGQGWVYYPGSWHDTQKNKSSGNGRVDEHVVSDGSIHLSTLNLSTSKYYRK